MKAFTAHNQVGPQFPERPPTNGGRSSRPLLGGAGACIWAVAVPFYPNFNADPIGTAPMSKSPHMTEKGLGKIVAEPSNASNKALVRRKVPVGYRGGVSYDIGYAELLAQGQLADGIAGRISEGEELLVMTAVREIVKARRTGRRKRNPVKLVIDLAV